MKLYRFRTVPLSIISSYSLYTQQWYMSYRFADNFQAAGSRWNSMEYIRYTCSRSGINVLNEQTQVQCKSYDNEPGHIFNRFPKLTHHKFVGKRTCVQQLFGMWVYVSTAANFATSNHALVNSAMLLHHIYT
jgi:hypothetical protein